MKINLNQVYFGLAPGLIFPALIVYLFYLNNYSYVPLMRFLTVLAENDILTKVISICVLVNLIVFFFFIRKNYLYGARGVMIATFIYVLAVVTLKFVL